MRANNKVSGDCQKLALVVSVVELITSIHLTKLKQSPVTYQRSGFIKILNSGQISLTFLIKLNDYITKTLFVM